MREKMLRLLGAVVLPHDHGGHRRQRRQADGKRMPTVKVSTHDGYKGIFFRIPTLGQARGARPCLQQRRGTVHVLRYPSLCIFGKKYVANTVANTYSWVGVGLSNTSLGQLLAS